MTQPFNFSWFVEDKIAGFGYPDKRELPFLAEQGITEIVNTTGVDRYGRHAAEQNITVHSIAIEEFCPPTLEQIKEFLDIVASAKGPVGVHCRGGMGRTGTMLACYLVACEGYSAAEAISETRRRRWYSIETRAQETAVKEFYQSLCNSQ